MLTTSYSGGAPIWVDLAVPDVAAAAQFYQALFGWEFQSAGPEAGGYGFFRLDGKVVAAGGPVSGDGDGPAWTVYFHTDDADATARAVERAGGTVRHGPLDVFTAGRMAAFTDPTGARFAVWQPGERAGLDAVSAPNMLSWTELYSSDLDAARDFYRAVFDWGLQDVPMPGVTYTVVTRAGGGDKDDQGGMMPLNEQLRAAGFSSAWTVYFEVTDCDRTVATVSERGGSVRVPPMDAPGVGRLAAVADPAGATFAVVTYASSS